MGWFSVFAVLSGNILSIAFGRNLDAHAPSPDSSPMPPGVSQPTSAHQCLAGRECYVQSLYWNLWACAIAVGLLIWAGRRDWLHWQRQSQLGEQMDIVGWETAGEDIGSEDLDP
ncbi:hypothetical protein BJV78DRAFT_1185977 [Lactifluus subvellereus]|nr:hypothetical protein BJV78DRAFT_1185977 [Lactifluus subvellereus]